MDSGIGLLATIVAFLMALVLHEFAHALAGHFLGDDTARRQGRLTLNPAAHIDPFTTLALPILSYLATGIAFGAARPVPFNPWAVRGGRWGAALVAAAGPLTNLLLAVFFALWWRLIPFNDVSATFFEAIIVTNAGLFVFNMIPFPPLDGSRVLYAVAPEGVRDLMDRVEQMGFWVIFAIMIVGYQFIGHWVTGLTLAIVRALIPMGPLP